MRVLLLLAVTAIIIGGCKKSITDSPQSPLVYLKSYTNSNGDVAVYSYDSQDRMIRELITGIFSSDINFYYTGNSRQVSHLITRNLSGSSKKYVFSYDGQNRVTRAQVYDSSSILGFMFLYHDTITYNGPVQRCQAVNPNGSLGPNYDVTKNADGTVTKFEHYSSPGVRVYWEEHTAFDNKHSVESMLPEVYYYRQGASKNNTTSFTIYNGALPGRVLPGIYEYNADGYPTKANVQGVTYNYVYEKR